MLFVAIHVLFAQTLIPSSPSDDITTRLNCALAASGTAADASAALSRRNFGAVQQDLLSAKALSDTDHAELLALQGAVAFLAGDWNSAIAGFHESNRLRPLPDNDRFTLAMAFVRLGDDERARSQLAGLAAQHPDRALYLYWLGRLDYSQRRYREAVDQLQKAATLDRANRGVMQARIQNALGLTFDMLGDFEAARDCLQKAVELNRIEAHPSAWFPHDLGYLLLRMNRPQEAEAALRESLGYDPALAQTHYHLGRTLEKEGRELEAVSEYGKAASADTDSSDACYSLAILYRKLNRETDAEAMFAEFRKRKQAARSQDPAPAGEEAAKSPTPY